MSNKAQNPGYIQKVVLPKTLTAENGAKALLSGEFFESIEVSNNEYCGCGECDYCHDFPDTPDTIEIKVQVTWQTIKEIYTKIVSYYESTGNFEIKNICYKTNHPCKHKCSGLCKESY